MMDVLLEECRSFPTRMPYLREKDGVRRRLRCVGCWSRERPESDDRFRLCDVCLSTVRAALDSRKPVPGMLLFRTYTPEARCEHASDDTVLVVYPWRTDDFETSAGACANCFDREAGRREGAG